MNDVHLVETDRNVPLLAMSLHEASKSVGVSEKHFREELLPRIPHLRIGRRVVIPVDGLRDWLKAHSQ